ncbi:MAG: N-6 DNA methylase [Chloroflexota bacterium]|nr:N-6 DNA methylase [Chloroflexota bacterium]MDE2960950.1 N-6 DNA methylase [Chloroflexota bacterium]
MPSHPHIERYHADLQRFREFGGSDNEQSIRRAFAVCLDSYCRDHREKLALVDELDAGGSSRSTGTGIRPDGTVKDSLRMARGYWEAKDTHDDLDAEIQAKFNRGYPRDNILFEDSQTAVLIQNGNVAMRVDMSRPGELHRLIRRFLDYELPEIEEFRQARQQFKADLPAVLESLREAVADAEAGNADYQAAAALFLSLCRQTISPDVTDADVREMLLQHILTRDIFLRVFAEDQFHRENNVARQLDALESTFFTGDARREAIDRLRLYYGAIGRAADEIADYAEKQQFLKAIYEDFYQAYNPAAADRLGVVYTPNEVVDFIIRGTDHLLQKHFGRTLADDNVQILDPATGTGTFITGLINHLPADRLEYKYRNEIHANEVAILPYYIANLNIEYTYKERTGRYLEFPNLCFVDTLDNMDWQGASGGAVTRQGAFNLGGVSEENWIRVQEQNEKAISVIIGNPPYNANQQNENDNNKNREYPAIDRRISETYIAASTAQKTKQYDMYKRFIRWASDRLADDGIIGFITNRAYLDTRQDDGFRQLAAQEFTDIYVLDLGSDVRRNPKISGTTHNVFGIQTGVAIGFFVREKAKMGECNIHYARREDAELASEKLAYLRDAPLDSIGFESIVPDSKSYWLDQSNSRFEELLPLANRETKLAKTAADEQAVFGLFSLGIATNRDEWTYDFDFDALSNKVLFFSNVYREELQRYEKEKPAPTALGDWIDRSIKWTSELESHLVQGDAVHFSTANMTRAMYRPFVAKHCYYAPIVTHRRYQMPQIFPHQQIVDNPTINFAARYRSFYVLASNKLVDLHFVGDNQCLPLYRYTPDGERVSNITQWGLRRFREHYGDDGITAEDIFAYVYAMLHDPAYRQRFEIDLRREFPRVYFQQDFAWWAGKGRELLDLHLGFETAEPWPLERVEIDRDERDKRDEGDRRNPRVILRADKERGIIRLDEQTTLAGVPNEAWWYELGSRSALEWVLDQYKERKPRDPTIRERFNTYRFADHKERVIDLLRRVCTVSVKTYRITDYELDRWTEIDPDEGLELRPEVLVELLEYEQEVRAAGRSVMPDEDFARLKEDLKERGLYP